MKWNSLYDAANRQRMVQSSAFEENTEAAREQEESRNKNKQIYCCTVPVLHGPCSAGRGCCLPSAPRIFRVLPRPGITLPAQDSPLDNVLCHLQRLSLLKEKQFRFQAEHLSMGCDLTFRNSEQGMLTAFVFHSLHKLQGLALCFAHILLFRRSLTLSVRTALSDMILDL